MTEFFTSLARFPHAIRRSQDDPHFRDLVVVADRPTVGRVSVVGSPYARSCKVLSLRTEM